MMIKRKIKRAPLEVVRRHWADVGSEQEQTGGPLPNLPASMDTTPAKTQDISAAEPTSSPPWLGKMAVPQPNGADANEVNGALGMFSDGVMALPFPLHRHSGDCFDGQALRDCLSRSASVVQAMESMVEQMPVCMHSHMRQQLGMMKAMHECIDREAEAARGAAAGREAGWCGQFVCADPAAAFTGTQAGCQPW